MKFDVVHRKKRSDFLTYNLHTVHKESIVGYCAPQWLLFCVSLFKMKTNIIWYNPTNLQDNNTLLLHKSQGEIHTIVKPLLSPFVSYMKQHENDEKKWKHINLTVHGYWNRFIFLWKHYEEEKEFSLHSFSSFENFQILSWKECRTTHTEYSS